VKDVWFGRAAWSRLLCSWEPIEGMPAREKDKSGKRTLRGQAPERINMPERRVAWRRAVSRNLNRGNMGKETEAV